MNLIILSSFFFIRFKIVTIFFFSSNELLRAIHKWMCFLKKFDKNKFRKIEKIRSQRKKFSSIKKQNIEILKTIEWSIDFALLNSYFFENCNILTKTRFLKILFLIWTYVWFLKIKRCSKNICKNRRFIVKIS